MLVSTAGCSTTRRQSEVELAREMRASAHDALDLDGVRPADALVMREPWTRRRRPPRLIPPSDLATRLAVAPDIERSGAASWARASKRAGGDDESEQNDPHKKTPVTSPGTACSCFPNDSQEPPQRYGCGVAAPDLAGHLPAGSTCAQHVVVLHDLLGLKSPVSDSTCRSASTRRRKSIQRLPEAQVALVRRCPRVTVVSGGSMFFQPEVPVGAS